MINLNVTEPQGAQGAQGSQGVQGAQGTQGANGAAGSNGAQGHQGYIGTSGSVGTQGFQGSTGNSGSDSAPVTYTYETIGDSSVSLLLHMEGANDSTTFTDKSYSVKTVAAFGNAKISTSASKFGSSAAAFDGTGDYLRVPYSADLNLASTDFTIEFWVNFNAIGVVGLFSKHTSGTALDYEIALINSTTIRFNKSNLTPIDATVPALSTGTWYHMAFVGSGGSVSIYLNGTRYAGPTAATIGNSVTSYIVIGASSWNSPAAFLNGYMDEIRLTKGTARYTSNFTPSASAFSNADEYSSLPASASVGQTVYSSSGIYVCSSAFPLVWKKYAVSPSTITL
jgi:hypothetical protein